MIKRYFHCFWFAWLLFGCSGPSRLPAGAAVPLPEAARSLSMTYSARSHMKQHIFEGRGNVVVLKEGYDQALVNGKWIRLGSAVERRGFEWVMGSNAVQYLKWVLVPSAPEPEREPPRRKSPDKREWKYVVIHHSATDTGCAAEFDKLHHNRGWEHGLGYHFVIGNGSGSRDGQVETGPRWKKQLHGAHAGVTEYNEQGIGICLVGNFDGGRPSPRQKSALVSLVRRLQKEHGIPDSKVILHRDIRNTHCPGTNVTLASLGLAPRPSWRLSGGLSSN